MDVIKKYKLFAFAAANRSNVSTGRLTVVGEAFVTATQLSIIGEENLSRMCYLKVLNVQKATEDVDARTHFLRDKVSSAHAFFQASNE